MRWLPNALTLLRMALTAPIVLAILAGDCPRALGLSLLAGSTDGVDGFLARRFGWSSRLGAYLDPIADKLLLTSLYLAFGAGGLVPMALVWLVVGRDLGILLMAGIGFFFTSIRDFPPTIWGKISTLIQIVAALTFLSSCAGWSMGQKAQGFAIWAVAAATAWSGAHYLLRGVRLWKREQQRTV